MNSITDRIRKHNRLDDGALIGVRGSFGKDVEVDTSKGNRDIIVVANTDDIDLDDEVVVPSGADTSYFFKNGKIFVDHWYDTDRCVASLRKAMAYPSPGDHRAWRVRMRVMETELGEDVLTIARESGIGSSIGFEPVSYGPPTEEESKRYDRGNGPPRSVARKWKWLELSLTCMPCNVACQGGVARVDETRSAVLDELVTKGRIKRASAVAFGLPTTPKRRPMIVVPEVQWRTPLVVVT